MTCPKSKWHNLGLHITRMHTQYMAREREGQPTPEQVNGQLPEYDEHWKRLVEKIESELVSLGLTPTREPELIIGDNRPIALRLFYSAGKDGEVPCICDCKLQEMPLQLGNKEYKVVASLSVGHVGITNEQLRAGYLMSADKPDDIYCSVDRESLAQSIQRGLVKHSLSSPYIVTDSQGHPIDKILLPVDKSPEL